MLFLNVVSNTLQGSMWTQVLTVLVLALLINFSNHAYVVGQSSPSTSFSFIAFGPPEDGRILTSRDAVFNPMYDSYDMTSNASYADSRCGRIVYKDKVRMVDKASRKVASFNTTFLFSFHHSMESVGQSTCGEGMVFTFSASPNITMLEYTGGMYGHGMCTFDIDDKSASNSVFAVKFDSHRSGLNIPTAHWIDPSDSIIGLIVSNKGTTTMTEYNLCGNNITDCDYFCGDKGLFTAWIDYDGAGQTLEVRLGNGSLTSRQKPADALLLVSNVVLDEVLDEEMYVGFTAATYWGNPGDIEIHRIRSWFFNSSISSSSSPVPSPPGGISDGRHTKSKSQAGLIVGICAAILGAALMGLLLFCYFKHKNMKLKSSEKPAEQSTSGLSSDTNSRVYTFQELCSITKNFNNSELLSSGAFGDVYKGTPPSGGRLVAVKRIKETKGHGQASFLAEANSLRQIRHRNLLQLRGWCEATEGLFLVYDFMSNGSLDRWLHPHPDQETIFEGLSWNVRHFVLAGVAAGLEYLHEGWVQCVLHRDIKSSNVMLDANFNAYLGDFGLARLVDHNKVQKTTMLAGTLGYMAPEMHFTGKATKETDVYAFGVLVLEVVCGRRPLLDTQDGDEPGDFLLLERVWRAHEAGNISRMVDPRLLAQRDLSWSQNRDMSEDFYERNQWAATTSDASHELETIASILQLGLLCCLPNPTERPSMQLVNQWFQACKVGATEFPALPVKKPAQPRQFSAVTQSSEGTSSSQWSDGTRSSVQTSTRSSENFKAW